MTTAMPCRSLRYLISLQDADFLREGFPFDLAQIEPAVVAHKINYSVKLLVYEVRVVADY